MPFLSTPSFDLSAGSEPTLGPRPPPAPAAPPPPQQPQVSEAAARRLREAEERLREAIQELHQHHGRDEDGGGWGCCVHQGESCLAHAAGNLCQTFLLSYGVRVGIGILLRAFKLARRRSYGSLLDLKLQLAKFLTEKPRKHKKIQQGPSELWLLLRRARRCAGETRRTTSDSLDWEAPHGGKKSTLLGASTSTLHNARRKPPWPPATAAPCRQTPDPPSRGLRRRGYPVERSGEPRTRARQQIRGGAPQSRNGEEDHRQQKLLQHRLFHHAGAGKHTPTHT